MDKMAISLIPLETITMCCKYCVDADKEPKGEKAAAVESRREKSVYTQPSLCKLVRGGLSRHRKYIDATYIPLVVIKIYGLCYH